MPLISSSRQANDARNTVNAVAPLPRLCASVYACRALVGDRDVDAAPHGRPRRDSWPPGERKLGWTPAGVWCVDLAAAPHPGESGRKRGTLEIQSSFAR